MPPKRQCVGLRDCRIKTPWRVGDSGRCPRAHAQPPAARYGENPLGEGAESEGEIKTYLLSGTRSGRPLKCSAISVRGARSLGLATQPQAPVSFVRGRLNCHVSVRSSKGPALSSPCTCPPCMIHHVSSPLRSEKPLYGKNQLVTDALGPALEPRLLR